MKLTRLFTFLLGAMMMSSIAMASLLHGAKPTTPYSFYEVPINKPAKSTPKALGLRPMICPIPNYTDIRVVNYTAYQIQISSPSYSPVDSMNEGHIVNTGWVGATTVSLNGPYGLNFQATVGPGDIITVMQDSNGDINGYVGRC